MSWIALLLFAQAPAGGGSGPQTETGKLRNESKDYTKDLNCWSKQPPAGTDVIKDRPDRGVTDWATGYGYFEIAHMELFEPKKNVTVPMVEAEGGTCGCRGLGCPGDSCKCGGRGSAKFMHCQCGGFRCPCKGKIRRVCPNSNMAEVAFCAGAFPGGPCSCGGSRCPCKEERLRFCDAAKEKNCLYCNNKTREDKCPPCRHDECSCERGTVCREYPISLKCDNEREKPCDCRGEKCDCPKWEYCGDKPPTGYRRCGGTKVLQCTCKSKDPKCPCAETVMCKRRYASESDCPAGGAKKTKCGCGHARCGKQCPEEIKCGARARSSCPNKDADVCTTRSHTCRPIKELDTGTAVLVHVASGAKDAYETATSIGKVMEGAQTVGEFVKDKVKDAARDKALEEGAEAASDKDEKEEFEHWAARKLVGSWQCYGITEAWCGSGPNRCCGTCSCGGHNFQGGTLCNCPVTKLTGGTCGCTQAKGFGVKCKCND